MEILNEDGSMARLPQLVKIAAEHKISIISIKDLVAYRMDEERLIKREVSTKIMTKFGEFEVTAYRQMNSGDIHVALVKGEISKEETTLVRVHSATEVEDVMGFLFKDFGDRISKSLKMIQNAGSGVFLFMRQSDLEQGDLVDSLKAIAESDDSMASSAMPASRVQKDFGIGAQILNDLGLGKMQLITNNPKKRVGLIGYGLEIVDHIKM